MTEFFQIDNLHDRVCFKSKFTRQKIVVNYKFTWQNHLNFKNLHDKKCELSKFYMTKLNGKYLHDRNWFAIKKSQY